MNRICVKCSKEKDLEDFKKLHGSGYSNYCEYCRGQSRASMRRRMTKEERTAQHKAWREANPEKTAYRKKRNLLKLYGLTVEEFDRISEEQGHVCRICGLAHKAGSFFDRLVVDHCHTTGKLRGLLCTNCNTAIGLFKESISNMQRAIEYVRGGQLSTDHMIQR